MVFKGAVMLRFLKATVLVIAAVVVCALPVLAQSYYADINLSESNGNNYAMFPAKVPMNVTNMVTQGYLTATGLDSQVMKGVSRVPHMLASDRLLFASALSGHASNPYTFTTGNAALANYELITGWDGYAYTPDAGALEPGAGDFEIEADGWVDPDMTSGGRAVYKEGATGIITMPGGEISGMTLFEDPQDISPSVFAAWTTVDLHEYIPSEASGVVLRIESNGVLAVGIRHGDSTDNRTGDVDEMCWAMVGVNADEEIDVYIQNANVKVWLVGFTSGNFVFRTNAIDKTPGVLGAWADMDCSAEAPNAVGLIFEVQNNVGGVSSFGLRKNGSTDNRTSQMVANGIGWAVIGCDTNQIVEYYEDAAGGADVYLIGYITQDTTFFTNATDKSIGAGVWTDIDCSSEAPKADYLVFEVIGGGVVADYGFRKNGSAENVVAHCNDHAWAVVECDENQIVEGWVGNAAVDFFLVGYITKGVFEPADCLVTDTGFTEADQTVTLTKDDLIYAPGYAMHFPDAANGEVDCGNIGNGAKFWISVWFKLDAQWAGGTGHIFAKFEDWQDNLRLYLSGSDLLHWEHEIANVSQFNITIGSPSASGKWEAGVWYHVFASLGQAMGGGAASDGARLRVDNGVAVTDANVAALNNTGDFVIGDRAVGATSGVDCYIANVVWGNDDVTAAEELALYQNVLPGDEQGAWYIDEGRGTNIIDYGAGGNDGTAGAACTWSSHEDRPCKLVLSVDGTKERGYARPVTVTDNGRRWEWVRDNVMPYANSITVDVAGVEQLRYEPTSYIVGTTLADETGANDGTIVWGTNPDGVAVVMGSLLEYPSSWSLDEVAPPDAAGEANMPEGMFPGESEMAGTNHLFYFLANDIASNTNTPVVFFWWLMCGIFIILTIAWVHRELQNMWITTVAGTFAIGACIGMSFLPAWLMLVAVMVLIGVNVMERKPSF